MVITLRCNGAAKESIEELKHAALLKSIVELDAAIIAMENMPPPYCEQNAEALATLKRVFKRDVAMLDVVRERLPRHDTSHRMGRTHLNTEQGRS